MAKHTEIEGYSVIVFVPVGHNQRRRRALYDRPHDAKVEADALKKAIRERLEGFGWDSIDIEAQEPATCDHCGAPWTEKSDTYNGNCCDADEEAEEQRKRDNGAQGVGA